VTTRAPVGAPAEKDWEQVRALLAAAAELYLVCHVSPDGDALGSALATALGLRQLGKRVQVSFGDDPFAVPRSLAFLPGQEFLVPPACVGDVPQVMVVFDSSAMERLGLLAPKAAAARTLVVVDHHVSNTGFGTHHLVDASAPATVVLVAELLRRLDVTFTPEIATALYTGLITDTGSFKYSNTTPATHELAGRLLATGIRHDEISRLVWDTVPFGYFKVLARALERTRLERSAVAGRGLVWTVIPKADRYKYGVSMDQIESVIDVVRKAVEAEVTVILKEDDDGSYKVSTRSRGHLNVGVACAALGGGGHPVAAGFTAYQDVDTILSRLRNLLTQAADSGS